MYTRLHPFLKKLAFIASILLLLNSCKKEIAVNNPPVANASTPIANAGTDVTATIFSCYDKTIDTVLNGSGSSDPENNIVYYTWKFLSGPPGSVIKYAHSYSSRSPVEKLSRGIHSFELTVTDQTGLSSKDTVLINVLGNAGIPTEYNLDMMINTSFTFYNNYNYPWEDPIGFYYDYTWMRGNSIFLPLGQFNIGVFEYADSVGSSSALYGSQMQIRTTIAHSYLYLDGDLGGINFKQLIMQGGGSFTGTFTVTWGSAEYCNPQVFANLPPLTVTGNLNTTTGMVNLRVIGRAFF
ncbi:MAG: hypothetical protein ABIP79_12165 [Chitinophagaceae bacterium]